MELNKPLFTGSLVCFTPIDYEHDPQVESRWTHDTEYLRLVSLDPAIPLSPPQVRKKLEAIEKECGEGKNQFYFALRPAVQSEEKSSESLGRLVGFARVFWLSWNNSTAFISLGIGDPVDRRQGYGGEALKMLLRFCFSELNLYRLTALVPEYNTPALRLFLKAGFSVEVRQREALHRDGRRWDLLYLGLLVDEWERQQMPEFEFGGL